MATLYDYSFYFFVALDLKRSNVFEDIPIFVFDIASKWKEELTDIDLYVHYNLFSELVSIPDTVNIEYELKILLLCLDKTFQKYKIGIKQLSKHFVNI